MKIIQGENMIHKLVIRSTGETVIKIAQGSSDEEKNRIVSSFTNIAKRAHKIAPCTLRGQKKKNDSGTTIKLWTNNKKEHFVFDL